MSKSIDKRIVEMEFDNAQFEREVKRSQSTLEKLKELLNFGDQKKGLSDLSSAAKNVDMSSIASNVETVSDRFSTMGIVGMTVLQRLTDAAMDLGKKVWDISIGQIIEGGSSRALNLEQAAFRFKGIGVDVEKAMENAGKSVLGTMYGFDAAAAAGSQLAASGVDVGESLYKALRGTAGLAAMTGSEFEDISHIMVAIAGQGRLMGDQLNRFSHRGLNVAATLAKALGTSEENVRDMVSKGQISFDMFSEAMYEAFGEHATGASELFSGAMAHAKAALSRIGGTFAPAIFDNMRDVLLELRHFIDGFHDILKPYLPQFEAFANKVGKIAVNFLKDTDWSPMTSVVDGLINILKSLWSWIKPIGQAFRDIFPKTTTKALSDLTGRFKSFTEGLKATDKQSSNVRKAFKGLFSVVKVLGDIFSLVWRAIFKGVGIFDGLGNVILTVSGFIGGLIAKVLSYVDVVGWTNAAMDGLKKAFDIFKTAMEPVYDILVKIATEVGEKVVKVWVHFRDEVLSTIDPMQMFKNLVETVSSALVSMYEFFKPLIEIVKEFAIHIGQEYLVPGWEKFKDIAEQIWDILIQVKDGAVEAFNSIKAHSEDKFESASIAVGTFGDRLSDTKGKVTDLGNTIRDYFAPIIERLKQAWEGVNLGDFLGAAIVVWLVYQLKQLLDSFKEAKTSISDVFGGVVDTLGEVQNTLKAYQNDIKANMILKIAGAIALLAASVALIGMLKPEAVKQGLWTITTLFVELGVMVAIMNKLDLSKMDSTSSTILALGGALLLLAGAIYLYSKMDIEEIKSGLGTVALLLAGLGIAMKIMSGTNLVGVAGSIMAMALAISMMVIPLMILGKMDYETAAQGLDVMAVMLFALTGAMAALGMVQKAGGNFTGISLGIMAMAAALLILTVPIKAFGEMSWGELVRGLVGIIVPLAALGALAVVLAPVAPILVGLGAGLALIGASVALVGIGVKLTTEALLLLADTTEEQISNILESVDALIKGLLVTMEESIPLILDVFETLILELAERIPRVAPAVLESLLVVLSEIGLTILEWVIEYTPKAIEKFKELYDKIVKAIKDKIDDFKQAGKDAVAGVIEGIKAKFDETVQAAKDLGKKILDGIKNFLGIQSPSTAMAGVGKDAVLGLIKGIGSKFSSAAAKAKELGQRILNGIKSLPGKLLKKGKEAAGDFVKGIRNKFSDAKSKATELGNKVKDGLSNLKSQLETRGKDAISGFISGMGSKLGAVATAARNVASRALSAIKDRLNIASPSKVFRDEVGAMIALGVRDGIKIEARKAAQAAEDMGKDVLTRTREYLDKKKYYNQISLEEELYVWQQAIKKLKYGSDERKAMDRELYRVRNEIQRKGFEHSKNWIDKEKFYNRLSLGEELAAWQRVQARYKKGTEERKEADRQVYSLKKTLVEQQEALDNSYYENSKRINDKLKDDIKSLNDDYDNAVESRAKSLAETWGLFNKVDKKDAVSGKDLLSNLEGQVEAFNEWEKEIHKLSGRGLTEELMKELKNLGPNSVEEIKALNSLSNTELENYSNLWLNKFDNARKYAIGEMQDLRTETDSEIANLTKDAETELAELESVWVTKTAELTGTVVVNFDKMKVDVGTSVTAMKTETVADFDDWVKDIKKTVEKQDWQSVGSNMISGISKGITKNSKKLINQMKALATDTINTVNDVLGIKSPSRAFAKIGAFAIQGFINGVDSLNDQASKSTSDVATDAMNALKNALGRMDEAIDSDVDLNPVIRPVLDMDDVINELNSNLGGRNIDVSAAQTRLSRLRREAEIERQNGSKSTSEPKQEVHYHAHLKAYGSLPKKAIDKMAKDFDASIKSLEDRRKMNRGEEVIF